MDERKAAPDTVTLRVTRVVHLMMLGRWFTTQQVAQMTGLTESGARKLLERMIASEHVPVACVDGNEGVQVYGIVTRAVIGHGGGHSDVGHDDRGHDGREAGQADRASDGAV